MMLSGFNIYIHKSEHGISSGPPIVDLSDVQRYHKRLPVFIAGNKMPKSFDVACERTA